MRLRLRALEATLDRVDRVLAEEENVAAALVKIWRNKYGETLDQEFVYRLARELDAGSPDAFEEWQEVYGAETAHVRARAAEWIAEARPEDHHRWHLLFDDVLNSTRAPAHSNDDG